MSNALLLIVPEDKKKKEADIPENAKWTDTAIRFVSKAAPLLFSRSPLVALSVSAWEFYETFAEWNKSRGAKFLTLSRTAAAHLRFPPGHSQEGVLYAQHPTQHDKYFPCASFHRFVFEHKFAEAIRILTALGATRIRVEHVTGWKRDFGVNIQAPIEGIDISASAGSTSSLGNSLMYEAEYEGHKTPELPEDIAWYSHEPTWQSTAEGRIKYKLKKFNLVLSYTEDYGVNADLAVKAEKLSISLGGKFGEHTSTVWRLEGEFL
jgi:hypothetical protein